MSLPDFNAMMSVNLYGTFFGTKFGGRAIAASGGGSIVNIASIQGLGGATAFSGGYSASKSAVISLTQTAAVELRDLDVRVNAVAPGMTMTPLLESVLAQRSPEEVAMLTSRQGKIADPRDIAATVAFLASDDARLITGVVIPVDFGRAAKFEDQNQDKLQAWLQQTRDSIVRPYSVSSERPGKDRGSRASAGLGRTEANIQGSLGALSEDQDA
jgi:NAD(P)-dependent dehydrogenase (short-subunit alcohol dehydrogenase family)